VLVVQRQAVELVHQPAGRHGPDGVHGRDRRSIGASDAIGEELAIPEVDRSEPALTVGQQQAFSDHGSHVESPESGVLEPPARGHARRELEHGDALGAGDRHPARDECDPTGASEIDRPRCLQQWTSLHGVKHHDRRIGFPRTSWSHHRDVPVVLIEGVDPADRHLGGPVDRAGAVDPQGHGRAITSQQHDALTRDAGVDALEAAALLSIHHAGVDALLEES